ncbi:hypothetical protein [Pontibacter ramchanderi]|uniref:SpoIIAA-like protein n=1 Tax=Pontibacter ramchanderi TaxID=1179743 RepID=A0A2N3V1S9_9BACT|nr:hypothetical protein [Pontibacter ramchanderi]PKV75575.1 hypothetical protein BD749_0520 [Pontibacter ramchanderi]
MKQYKDNYCQISYNHSSNQVYLKWLIPPDEAALLNTYNKALDMAIYNKAESWIADNSIGFHLNVSMQRSLATLAAGRLPHTTLKRFARVTPVDVFQELITHKVFSQIGELTVNSLEFEVFHRHTDAKAWCMQVTGQLSVN